MSEHNIQEVLLSLIEKVSVIEDRVTKARALNGGFEHLVEDVKSVARDVRSIKSAMYEPDSGLFSRVKELESESTRRWDYIVETKPLVEEHKEVLLWKKQMERELEEFEAIKIELAEFRSWKTSISKVVWVIATAAATMWAKFFMDFVIK